jgi:hypothetical protein
MKRADGIGRMVFACLFVVVVSAEHPQAAMVPIAEGNMWVYKHSDTILRGLLVNEGLFTMRMDSVAIRTDTALFTMTTVDSGVAFPAASPYNSRSVKKYMVINGILFLQNTSNGSWQISSTNTINFTPHITMRYDNCLSWRNGWLGGDTGSRYSSHTDTSTVVVNGTEIRNFYTTDTSFYRKDIYYDFNLGDYISNDTRLLRDTVFWLDSVGMIYHFNEKDSSTLTWPAISSRETYALLSFNGTPVSIAPIPSSAKAVASAAKKSPAYRTRKVFWLGATPYRQPAPTHSFNLQGRRFNGIEHAQLLIMKEALPPAGRSQQIIKR